MLQVYDAYQDEKRYSKVISMDEIRENDYNLNIRRYADTSPPPEPYDVKASCTEAYLYLKWRMNTSRRPFGHGCILRLR